MAVSLQKLGRYAAPALIVAAVAFELMAAPAAPRTAHVLVIYTSSRDISAFDEFHQAFLEAVRTQRDIRVETHAEFLDEIAGRGEPYETAVVEFLRQKHAKAGIEIVVGVTAPAARLAGVIQKRAFPEALLIFGAVDRRVAEAELVPAGVVGVVSYVDLQSTIKLALDCHPGTRRMAYVIGGTSLELSWRERVVAEISAADPSLEIIDLVGLDADGLMQRLETLPNHTVVLWASLLRDGAGVAYSPREILLRANSVSTAPIYGMFDHMLGNGIVGGYLTSFETSGGETGLLTLRILRGADPFVNGSLPFAANVVAFDARELARWGIPESRLPKGSIVRYQEPSVWESYGWYIVGALVLFLAQALLIAGLLAQRSRRLSAQRAVAEQLAFERLVSDLSKGLSDVAPSAVEGVLADAVESARMQFGADRFSLLVFGGEAGTVSVSHSAVGAGVRPLEGSFNLDAYPEMLERLRLGQFVRIENLDDIEEGMPTSYAALGRAGVEAAVMVPLHIGGVALGVLGLARLHRGTGWSDEVIARLQILADIFANALGRRSAAEQVRKSEELSHAVLGSLSAQVCVIDRDGRVVAGNDAWQRAVPASGVDVACTLMRRPCGMDCDSATSCESAESTHARNGIRSVIDGEQSHFSMEYRLTRATGDTWHVMTAERLRLPEGGAVVSNQNVTARKRAELEAEQRRQELTHFSRVSAMGELAASLAHELNQPLTGVLTNAQAAVRFLGEKPPNVSEVREILYDIIEDDRRAGEVIRRLRSMLQAGSVESVEVDINDVVTNVVKLLASDAVLRDVTIETVLAPGLAPVVGDRIQIQQVVLNLVVNAMDAMRSDSRRRVTVVTAVAESGSVRLSVSDTGPGIDHDKLGKVFQPFFTTKDEGLGMGLAIARTIVEAHGGVLWAENNPERGASFLFRLPVAKAAAESA